MERNFEKFSPEIKQQIIEFQNRLNEEIENGSGENKSVEFSTEDNITYRIFFKIGGRDKNSAIYEFDYLTVV